MIYVLRCACVCAALMGMGLWCAKESLAREDRSEPGFLLDPDLDPGPLTPQAPALRKKHPQKKKKKPLMGRGTFSIGLGYGPGQGFLMQARVASRDLFGIDGLQLSSELELGLMSSRSTVRLGYSPSHSRFFTYGRFSYRSNRLGLLEDGERDLVLQSLGGVFGVGLKLAEGWRLSVGSRIARLSMERQGLLHGRGLVLSPEMREGDGFLSALRITLEHRPRRAFDPKTGMKIGFRFKATLEGSHSLLGSDYHYLHGKLEASYQTMLPGGLHWSIGVQMAGVAGPLSGVPFALRPRVGGLFGGGSWLSPVGPALEMGDRRVSLGGRAAGVLYTELRVPLWKSAGLYAFGALEAGVVAQTSTISPTGAGQGTLHTPISWAASGIVGLLWNSPIGPLRFGLTIPLVRGPGDPPVGFGFGIGGRF